MKQLGMMWKEASDAEKAPFEAMAKKDKTRYEKEKEPAAAAASKIAPPESAPETETVGKSKKQPKKQPKKDKDENKPKRCKSAYLFFCDDKRSQLKEENPELSMIEMSKQFSIMWKEASGAEKAPFEAMAKKDKIRYEEEKKQHAKEKEPAASRDAPPKRCKSAYLFFCDDKRSQLKEENPELSMIEM